MKMSQIICLETLGDLNLGTFDLFIGGVQVV